MQKIILDDEFRFLLPPLDEQTFRDLEAAILEHGLLVPLVLWRGILIDGYHRYRICSEHSIPFSTIDMEFDSREDVIIWIIENQISRRNLTPMQLSFFRGLHYNTDKKAHGDIDRVSAKSAANALNNAKPQNVVLRSGSTARRLAEHYDVSHETIRRNSRLAEGLTAIGKVNPDVKKQILSGEVRVGKNRLEALSNASAQEVRAVVREIEEGVFVSRAPRSSANVDLTSTVTLTPNVTSDSILPELRQLNNIISSFAGEFNSMFEQLNSGNSAELKPVIRTFINQLEELYGSL